MIYSCCSEKRRSVVQASVGSIVATPTPAASGSGYKVGDVLALAQPGSSLGATVDVTAISAAGGVTAVTLQASGTGYSTASGVPTTGGSGTGCTLNLVCTPNGIDFLEVLAPAAIALGVPAQPLLLLHCLRPITGTVTTNNIFIMGGESVTGITAHWVGTASSPPAGLPAALTAYLETLSSSVLAVQTNVAGDLSPYTLRLVRDLTKAEAGAFEATQVLPGFDPQLAEVQFAFWVDCAAAFDCDPRPPACAPAPPVPPAINYLAKDYGSFRTVMLDRMNQMLQGSMATTEPDLGVALVETIAYIGDLLSYRQDAIASEAYLNTAQSRVSLRRHALLVDYHVNDGCNARVWMHLKVTGNDGTAIFMDRTVTRFYSYAPGMPPTLAFGLDNERAAILAGVQVFEPMEDANLYPEHNKLYFYTWGEANCCLPQGTTGATLRGYYPNLKVGDVLLFVEEMGPQTGIAADADLRHRCAVRLTAVTTHDGLGQLLVDLVYATDGTPLAKSTQTPDPFTEIQWSTNDALPFPVCLSSTFAGEDGTEQSLMDVTTAWGNIVLADHGLCFQNVSLGTVAASSIASPPKLSSPCNPVAATPPIARIRPVLPDSPLVQAVPLPLTGTPAQADPALSASALIQASNGQGALPSISLTSTVTGSTVTTAWRPQQDLLESGESDAAFVVEVESDGTATLRFGDNVNGRAPDWGTAFNASYRIGGGSAGNIGAESLVFKEGSPSIQSCINPMPAAGGMDPETSDQIRRRAPQAFLTQDRAVTLLDYEATAEQNAGINQAVATLRWTGSWYSVFVAAEPRGGGDLSSSLSAQLSTTLEQYRLAGQNLKLESPQYVSMDIELQITVDPNYFQAHVKQILQAVLGNQLLPNGQKGLFYPDNFTFGQTVYLGPVYAAARSVAGVVSVVASRFQPRGNASSQYLSAGAIRLGSLQVARLENDPSYPDHGRLTLVMGGGK